MSGSFLLNRRTWLHAAAAPVALAALPAWATPPGRSFHVCAFEKFIQKLSHKELADTLADIGFNGVEATVRKGGRIEPANAADELPALGEALAERGLTITIVTTDVLDADDPVGRTVLQAAASAGVKQYRMNHYRYDRQRSIPQQIAELKPKFHELAAYNRELGITGLYQNHSGWNFVGATVWDLYALIKDLPPRDLGMAFDIRHDTVEAGLSWDVLYQLVRKHVGAVFVKDFRWAGRAAEHAPLGTSIDPKFFQMIKDDSFAGPVSLHVEYLPDAGVPRNVEALRRDYATLLNWLKG